MGLSFLSCRPYPEEVSTFCTKFNLTRVLPLIFSIKAVAFVWFVTLVPVQKSAAALLSVALSAEISPVSLSAEFTVYPKS